MEKINQELEERVKALVKANKVMEAVTLVQNVLKLGLRVSKEIVDSYRIERGD